MLVTIKKNNVIFSIGDIGPLENGTFDNYANVFTDREGIDMRCLDNACSLLISRIRTLDSGFYSCLVQSFTYDPPSKETQTHLVEVKVRVPPSTLISQSESNVEDSTEVKCSAYGGYPLVSHIWLHLVDEEGKTVNAVIYNPTSSELEIKTECEERSFLYISNLEDLKRMSDGELWFQCGFEQVLGKKVFTQSNSLRVFNRESKPILLSTVINDMKMGKSVILEALGNPLIDLYNGIKLGLDNNCSINLNFTNRGKWIVSVEISSRTISDLESKCNLTVTNLNLTITVTNSLGYEKAFVQIYDHNIDNSSSYEYLPMFIGSLLIIVILICVWAYFYCSSSKKEPNEKRNVNFKKLSESVNINEV